MDDIIQDIRACQLCKDRFAGTATAHEPRPVVWVRPGARILVAGQAPGARVHESGKPFTDPSGDRLRDWLGIGEDVFYDRDKLAVVPMAFCFPGYNDKGSDLPPPPVCARTWHGPLMEALGQVRLRVLVGSYAMKWHLGWKGRVDDAVADWRTHAPGTFVLPHPSWRNTGWLKRNPYFEQDVVPALRKAVQEALA
jgi:uracil-DNA glycosylase